MKTQRPVPRPCIAVLLLASGLGLAFLPLPALAQDSAFLACDQYRDRGQRIACLEDALEAATAAQQVAPASVAPAPPAPAASPAVAAPPAVPAPQTVAPPAAAEQPEAAVAEEDGPSLLERMRNFGQPETARVNTDSTGQDELQDTITKLEKRNDLWIVTLSSGQVWMQEYPRTLNLREGDQITIYQAGFGNGYRMSTARLSGFIRVKRMR